MPDGGIQNKLLKLIQIEKNFIKKCNLKKIWKFTINRNQKLTSIPTLTDIGG